MDRHTQAASRADIGIGASGLHRARRLHAPAERVVRGALSPADFQHQALAHVVKISGCTVHIVDEHLDAGPILVQRCVEVCDDDTVESLSARSFEQEHIAYVEALRKLARGLPG